MTNSPPSGTAAAISSPSSGTSSSHAPKSPSLHNRTKPTANTFNNPTGSPTNHNYQNPHQVNNNNNSSVLPTIKLLSHESLTLHPCQLGENILMLNGKLGYFVSDRIPGYMEKNRVAVVAVERNVDNGSITSTSVIGNNSSGTDANNSRSAGDEKSLLRLRTGATTTETEPPSHSTTNTKKNSQSTSMSQTTTTSFQIPKLLLNESFLRVYYSSRSSQNGTNTTTTTNSTTNTTCSSTMRHLSRNCRKMWRERHRKEWFRHLAWEMRDLDDMLQCSPDADREDTNILYPVEDEDDALSLMRKDSFLTRKMSSLLHSEGLEGFFIPLNDGNTREEAPHTENTQSVPTKTNQSGAPCSDSNFNSMSSPVAKEMIELLHHLWRQQNRLMTAEEVRQFVTKIFDLILTVTWPTAFHHQQTNNTDTSQTTKSHYQVSFLVQWMAFKLWHYITSQLKTHEEYQNVNRRKLKLKVLGALVMLRFVIPIFWDPFNFGYEKHWSHEVDSSTAKENDHSTSEQLRDIHQTNSRLVCDLLKRVINGGLKQKAKPQQKISPEDLQLNNALIEQYTEKMEEFFDSMVPESHMVQFNQVDWSSLVEKSSKRIGKSCMQQAGIENNSLRSDAFFTDLTSLIVINVGDAIDLQNYLIEERDASTKATKALWDDVLPHDMLEKPNESFINDIPLCFHLVRDDDSPGSRKYPLHSVTNLLSQYHSYLQQKKVTHCPSSDCSEFLHNEGFSPDAFPQSPETLITNLSPYLCQMTEFLEFYERKWRNKLSSLLLHTTCTLEPTLKEELESLKQVYSDTVTFFGTNKLAHIYDRTKHTKLQKKMKPTSEMVRNLFLFGFKYKDLVEYEVVHPTVNMAASLSSGSDSPASNNSSLSPTSPASAGTTPSSPHSSSVPKHVFEFYLLPDSTSCSFQLRIKDYKRRRKLSIINRQTTHGSPIIGGQILDLDELLERLICENERQAHVRGNYCIDVVKLLEFLSYLLKC